MKTKTLYISDDGEVFENEKDCLNHEKKVANEDYLGKIYFYNFNREPLTFKEAYLNDEIMYIVINDVEGISLLKEWSKKNSYFSHPFDAENDFNHRRGLYYWNEKTELWEYWQDKIYELREMGEYFQQFEEEDE